MERWKQLEFEYARQLRESDTATRRQLYHDAYSAVAKLRTFSSDRPEERTAGTSKELVDLLAQMLDAQEKVLEVGCGRGYTCFRLASHLNFIVGTDVSQSALREAQGLLERHEVKNALINNVSALDLCDHFGTAAFSSVISIEVIEHLHPEDAEEHFRQVFKLLKPGGKYILVMPNRLNGPHDITRQEFPEMQEAIGFHLNESSYGEIVQIMGELGFNRFCSFYPFRTKKGQTRVIYIPYQVNVMCEILYRTLRTLSVRIPHLESLINIRLVAHKP